MALAAPALAAPNWARWQQHLPGSYTTLNSPSMSPYDTRTPPNGPLQPPIMAPHYILSGAYNPSPVASMASPHYQTPQAAYQLSGYHSPPATPHVSSPHEQDYNDQHGVALKREDDRTITCSQHKGQPYVEHMPSPASSESQISTTRSIPPIPPVTLKTITYNHTINPADQVSFGTEVDELMKAIQRRPGTGMDGCQQQQLTGTGASETKSRRIKKKYTCNGPNCNKTFTQKTHLDIHLRTHTGDKPYQCAFPGCKLTFSQIGNLKTHLRRHTGERPYKCEKCDRRFAQRGNVRAHEQTHENVKPFICILDECNKTFTQLGNMKTHQNNFHKRTLKRLTMKFACIINAGAEVPPHDRELFEYFAAHYKNSNKGIKGRGKDRIVAERKSKPSNVRKTELTTTPSPLSHIPNPPQHAFSSEKASHQGGFAAFSMAQGHANMLSSIPRGYEMFDMDDDHSTVPSSNASTCGMLYEEDNSREMAFGQRFY